MWYEGFPEIFINLQQEGYLMHSMLTHGLTMLRKANISSKGDCYSAFFQLSIGIERMLKIVFILNYRRLNDYALPSDKQLIDYGHGIENLYEKALEINKEIRCQDPINLSDLEKEMLRFLDIYAKKARYYNLDSLGKGQQNEDPLIWWDMILDKIAVEYNLHQVVKAKADKARAIGEAMDTRAFTIYYGLNKKPVSLGQGMAIQQLQETACKYAVYHMFQILSPIYSLIWELDIMTSYGSSSVNAVNPRAPLFHEFLHFLAADKQTILRRRTWINL